MRVLELLIKNKEKINIKEKNALAVDALSAYGFSQELLYSGLSVFKRNNDYIEILPEQISFKNVIQPAEETKDDFWKNISEFLEKFLDEVSQLDGMLHIIETKETNINIFEKSKEFANFDIDGLKGIGYRFFFDYNNRISEIKIEPLIKDGKNIFIDAVYNITIDNPKIITDLIESVMEDFSTKSIKLISNMKD